MMKKYLKIWLMMASRAAQAQLFTSWGSWLFLAGKIIRFIFTFSFLFLVLSGTEKLLSYTRDQVILFFLVFTLVDVAAQTLFRGVYWFRSLIVSGDYDLDLLKPLPSFFRPIFGWVDILDLITLVPLLLYFFYYLVNHNFFQTGNLILFFLLFLNSLVLSFSFHLIVCGVGILTTEVDHLVWIYRDLTGMAKFPTDIYPAVVQGLLTFVLPVIVLITVPAKALMGVFSWPLVIFSFVLGILSLWLAFKFWWYALRRYSSASS